MGLKILDLLDILFFMNYNSSVHTGKSDDDYMYWVFRKAFNQMLHDIFIKRLEWHMITRTLARRAQSWLEARSLNGTTESESVVSNNICIGVL